ncbi:tRNA uridine-5-carboxymethylaminomethyl(34) synthesis GTPase MnmE [Rhizobium sp. L1K21]|uniref:tRNA uridine-5-carboxymethylaminomethyl(34) synthesis GTPase MnmE n=1 Tax=Rhizobium sp. L1K21 TaxID=2954933 RepID=UPI0020935AF3|nr:tRNA uridine-5-carboxymethylaminomethyl(34) synthesis GTPase MnmE [Rhizobium sp. L1K21]MCO6188008.1 tRNA uridine-5-carboxymethylaminomethyl(34) synthesis GTPase MnmE [Rhizobium sp. L1K21]
MALYLRHVPFGNDTVSYQDTIYALSSGGLPSGVATIRISGPLAKEACLRVSGRVPSPRNASYLPLRDAEGQLLDRGLVMYFPGPASFTGEDSVEFQVHGSRAVVSAILAQLGSFSGFRLAEAGEFSRRAFENGKLDLVEIEGLGELINADTQAQRKQALRFAEGGASARYQSWMETLSFARAMIEAELDFSDEGDIPGAVSDQIWPQLETLLEEMNESLAGLHVHEIVREGFRVVIVGPPNVGKSSLLNHLAKRDVAIVTDIAGTTRDVIAVDLDLGGVKICLVDTAGIRDTEDPVERAGIERTSRELDKADLVLVLDSGEADGVLQLHADVETLRVRTKVDLDRDVSLGGYDLAISVKTGDGVDSLLERIQSVAARYSQASEGSIVLNQRHKEHVENSVRFLAAALTQKGEGLELTAEYLRNAADELGRITGVVSADALLGVIFSKFCVGK